MDHNKTLSLLIKDEKAKRKSKFDKKPAEDNKITSNRALIELREKSNYFQKTNEAFGKRKQSYQARKTAALETLDINSIPKGSPRVAII